MYCLVHEALYTKGIPVQNLLPGQRSMPAEAIQRTDTDQKLFPEKIGTDSKSGTVKI